MEKQRTIKNSVSLSGIGLHTGQPSTITFHSAPEDYGYRFIRTDLAEPTEIPALLDYVVDLSRGTTLGKNGVQVNTVEHVIAALAGMQIDNCKIELSGPEPPVGDGSSMIYVNVLLEAGIEEQQAERNYFVIDEPIRFTNDEKGVDIVALPTDDYRITVMVDYYNPALGSQHTGLFSLEKEFVSDFASARTFCFLTEIEMLFDQGLIQGGSLDNAIVIIDREIKPEEISKYQKWFKLDEPPYVNERGLFNEEKFRFKNEPARHKLLDMIGDLALCGFPIKAQILAARPGHASNIEFAKKIMALYKKKVTLNKFKSGKNKDNHLNIFDLLKILPHRYPFLLIDKILEINEENNTVVGVKNITVNEPCFQGHFPEKPIFPGVLICEAMAQTACLLLLHSLDDYTKYFIMYQGIKNAKFKRPVVPGDQLVMKMEMTGKRLNVAFFKGTAYVDGQVCTEIEITAAITEK